MNIEELAFKNRKSLAKLNELDLLDIIELLQDDRKQWVNQFSKTHNENVEIQQKNKQLKETIDKIFSRITLWKMEDITTETSKVLDELLDILKVDFKDSGSEDLLKLYVELQEENETLLSRIRGFKNQQKEFIKYLEDEIYSIEPKGVSINYNCEYDSEEEYIEGMKEQSKLNTLKEGLKKYKEIIGVDK
jgi:hypothetical protein